MRLCNHWMTEMSEEVVGFRAYLSYRRYNVGYAAIHWKTRNGREGASETSVFEVISCLRRNPYSDYAIVGFRAYLSYRRYNISYPYFPCSLTKKSTNLCTSSKHAPQTVEAPVCSCTSSSVFAPASTASLIIPFVIFIQWHTTLSRFILYTPSFQTYHVCVWKNLYNSTKRASEQTTLWTNQEYFSKISLYCVRETLLIFRRKNNERKNDR